MGGMALILLQQFLKDELLEQSKGMLYFKRSRGVHYLKADLHEETRVPRSQLEQDISGLPTLKL